MENNLILKDFIYNDVTMASSTLYGLYRKRVKDFSLDIKEKDMIWSKKNIIKSDVFESFISNNKSFSTYELYNTLATSNKNTKYPNRLCDIFMDGNVTHTQIREYAYNINRQILPHIKDGNFSFLQKLFEDTASYNCDGNEKFFTNKMIFFTELLYHLFSKKIDDFMTIKILTILLSLITTIDIKNIDKCHSDMISKVVDNIVIHNSELLYVIFPENSILFKEYGFQRDDYKGTIGYSILYLRTIIINQKNSIIEFIEHNVNIKLSAEHSLDLIDTIVAYNDRPILKKFIGKCLKSEYKTININIINKYIKTTENEEVVTYIKKILSLYS